MRDSTNPNEYLIQYRIGRTVKAKIVKEHTGSKAWDKLWKGNQEAKLINIHKI